VDIYLDTSVFGALLDADDPRRVRVTGELFETILLGRHTGYISGVVLEELAAAPERVRDALLTRVRETPLELLAETEETQRLTLAYEEAKIVPAAYRDDLRHVAVAVVYEMDALVSWNYRHLVNVEKRRAIGAVNLSLGRPQVEIVSPEEVPRD